MLLCGNLRLSLLCGLGRVDSLHRLLRRGELLDRLGSGGTPRRDLREIKSLTSLGIFDGDNALGGLFDLDDRGRLVLGGADRLGLTERKMRL
jgi:hypothetical protein